VTLKVVSLLGANIDEAASDLAADLTCHGIEAAATETSHEHRMELVTSGAADIVWLCGFLALELDLAGFDLVAAPSFVGEERASYRSIVIANGPSAGLEELCTSDILWAMNEEVSWSGHRALLAECGSRRLPVPSNICWSGSHLDSIRMVAQAEADAAAIDSTLWRWATADDVTAVDETRSWPSPPLLVRRELDRRLPQLTSLITAAGPLRGVARLEWADWSHLGSIRAWR
jgi:ABC-type phosphate/phosphonate transport system substrate-binding protein